MSSKAHSLTYTEINEKINLLIHNLINIKDTSGKFLQKLDDGRVIDTKGWNGWEWTHGVALYGLWKYRDFINGSVYIHKIIKGWFNTQLAKGTTKNVNTMAVFLTLAHLYEETNDRVYQRWLRTWADWAMYDLPRTSFGGMQHDTYAGSNVNELWDDTLMMTVLPLAKIGKVLNRPEYVEEAKRQFLTHIQFLFDTSTGLFFHGWKFEQTEAGSLGHNFACARWARGNSWVTIAIPDFLELLDLETNDPLRLHLLSILEAQCRALERLQDPRGLWRTLLDVPVEEGSYLEASATAGFAYGILKAVRKRYIGKKYEAMGIRAVKAVLGKISTEGELLDVSFGTAMGHDLQHYKDIERTSMPYGQAMAIMALGEFLWTFI